MSAVAGHQGLICSTTCGGGGGSAAAPVAYAHLLLSPCSGGLLPSSLGGPCVKVPVNPLSRAARVFPAWTWDRLTVPTAAGAAKRHDELFVSITSQPGKDSTSRRGTMN
jgi:hypothetical protein